MNNKFSSEEEIQIIELCFAYNIECSLSDDPDDHETRSQLEVESNIRFFYKYINKHLFLY